jgi:hypothetical protein
VQAVKSPRQTADTFLVRPHTRAVALRRRAAAHGKFQTYGHNSVATVRGTRGAVGANAADLKANAAKVGYADPAVRCRSNEG